MTKLSIEEQIIRINQVMKETDRDPILDYRLNFGAHRGTTIENMMKYDNGKDYLLYIYHNDYKIPKKLEKFIEENLV